MFKIKNEIKLIAIDMDGTLLNDQGIISDINKEAIQLASKKDIKVVLSTGRPLALCSEYADYLELKNDIITANGAQIWTYDKKLIEEYAFESEIAEELWHFGTAEDYYMWMVATNNMFRHSSRPVDFNEHKWIKIGFGKLMEVQKERIYEKLLAYNNLEITSSSPTNIEINRLGIHKAKGLQIVCERLGITMDNVVSIGDSMNDLTMIKKAQIGVAMKNAVPEILNIADAQTDTNNENGVAKVINHILRRL